MLFPPGSVPSAPRLETRMALLMIDLQNDFLRKDGKLFVENATEFLPKLPSLANKFREKGEVFWVQTEFEETRPTVCPDVESYLIVLEESLDNQKDSEPNTGRRAEVSQRSSKHTTRKCGRDDPEAFLARRYKRNWPRCCLPKSPGCELFPTVAKIVDSNLDSIVKKSGYSAFHTGSLLAILRTKLITRLYLCGSLSNVSIYATALDAVQHGLEVTIIEDCVGYRNTKCHEEAMRQMADAMGVNGTDYQELMDELGGLLGDVVTASTFHSSVGTREADGDSIAEKYSMRSKIKRWIDDMSDDGRADGDPHASGGNDNVEAGSAKRRSLGARNGWATANAGKKQDRRRTTAPSWQTKPSDANDNSEEPSKPVSPPATEAKVSKIRMRRPHIPSKPVRESSSSSDSGDRAPAAGQNVKEPTSRAPTGTIEADSDPTRCGLDGMLSTVERVRACSRNLRPTKRPRQPIPKPLSRDLIGERDSRITYNFLESSASPSDIFIKLSRDTELGEIRWQKMFHRSGEVPRLVAVQGEAGSDGSIPIYRHPSDEAPPLLPFSPTIQSIREKVVKAIGHPVNHVLIQRYRNGEDNISEHSDKTLDIVRGSSIVNVSLGAMRTMIFRTKKSACIARGLDQSRRASAPALNSKMALVDVKRVAQRIPLPHNSLFVLGQATNQIWLHAIRADKRPASEKNAEELAFQGQRISLTFRYIGTFVIPDKDLIWGQGATSKLKEEAKAVLKGEESRGEGEKMIQAFGQENHQSHDFNWQEHYGSGFDVVDFTIREDAGTAG